jgi:hypothetical protein
MWSANKKRKKPKFKEGDFVRLGKVKGIFEKGYIGKKYLKKDILKKRSL